jgi:SAM-dependent methyltransferase
MAKQYPHCSVVGVDLAPPPLLPDVMPKNLRFEIDNVNYGLKHFYGYFDIVHAKSVVTGINNYGELMDEATRCLKPGGLVIFIDGDPRILSVDRLHPVPFPGQESAGQVSWFRKIIHGTFSLYWLREFDDG